MNDDNISKALAQENPHRTKRFNTNIQVSTIVRKNGKNAGAKTATKAVRRAAAAAAKHVQDIISLSFYLSL